MIIAIDGPAGSGKGTVSDFLAQKYNLRKLDTGLLYRALAKKIITENLDPHKNSIQILNLASQITIKSTEEEGLRTEEVAQLASIVASCPGVREILNQVQRSFALTNPHPYQGIIMDGRDIGTVICPDAEGKIFLTASAQIRGIRRTNQIKSNPYSRVEITKIMTERDTRDQGRSIAPLSVAENSYIIDTTHLTINEVCSKTSSYVEQLLMKKKTTISSND